MDKLRTRRARGWFKGLVFGLGKESCQDYKAQLESYYSVLEGEVQASNESVKLAEKIIKAELDIATNDEKIGLHKTYGDSQKQVIKASAKSGREAIKAKTKEQLKKEKLENDLCTLADQLSSKIG